MRNAKTTTTNNNLGSTTSRNTNILDKLEDSFKDKDEKFTKFLCKNLLNNKESKQKLIIQIMHIKNERLTNWLQNYSKPWTHVFRTISSHITLYRRADKKIRDAYDQFKKTLATSINNSTYSKVPLTFIYYALISRGVKKHLEKDFLKYAATKFNMDIAQSKTLLKLFLKEENKNLGIFISGYTLEPMSGSLIFKTEFFTHLSETAVAANLSNLWFLFTCRFDLMDLQKKLYEKAKKAVDDSNSKKKATKSNLCVCTAQLFIAAYQFKQKVISACGHSNDKTINLSAFYRLWTGSVLARNDGLYKHNTNTRVNSTAMYRELLHHAYHTTDSLNHQIIDAMFPPSFRMIFTLNAYNALPTEKLTFYRDDSYTLLKHNLETLRSIQLSLRSSAPKLSVKTLIIQTLQHLIKLTSDYRLLAYDRAFMSPIARDLTAILYFTIKNNILNNHKITLLTATIPIDQVAIKTMGFILQAQLHHAMMSNYDDSNHLQYSLEAVAKLFNQSIESLQQEKNIDPKKLSLSSAQDQPLTKPEALKAFYKPKKKPAAKKKPAENNTNNTNTASKNNGKQQLSLTSNNESDLNQPTSTNRSTNEQEQPGLFKKPKALISRKSKKRKISNLHQPTSTNRSTNEQEQPGLFKKPKALISRKSKKRKISALEGLADCVVDLTDEDLFTDASGKQDPDGNQNGGAGQVSDPSPGSSPLNTTRVFGQNWL